GSPFCFLYSFPTRLSSDLLYSKLLALLLVARSIWIDMCWGWRQWPARCMANKSSQRCPCSTAVSYALTRAPIRHHRCFVYQDTRSEEHTSELQSRFELVCR